MNKDWICVGCNYHNFTANIKCRKCDNIYSYDQQTNQRINQQYLPKIPHYYSNDWHCSSCHYRNWQNNISCRRCSQSK